MIYILYWKYGRSYEAVIPPRVHPLDSERGRDLYLVLAFAGNREPGLWELLQLLLLHTAYEILGFPRLPAGRSTKLMNPSQGF